MINTIIKNEKAVKTLERLADELENLKTKETDLSFVPAMIFLILERFRTSNTPFPITFFTKQPNKKNKKNGKTIK